MSEQQRYPYFAYFGNAIDVNWPADQEQIEMLREMRSDMRYELGIYGPPAARPLLSIRYTRDVPTPDERAKRAAERAEAIARIPGELARLNALTGVEREVLDLPAPDEYGYCQGCDGGPDYTGDFPCRTVDLIAKRNGVNLNGYSAWLVDERTKR